MRGLLFEGLDVSRRRGGRRPWVAMVSFGVHAAAGAAVVLLPLLSAGDAPVIAWAPPIPDYVPDPPRVTLTPRPAPARPATHASQRTEIAAPTQSVEVPTTVPDRLPTIDVPAADPNAPMVVGAACPGCPPAEAGAPAAATGDGGESGDGAPVRVVPGGNIEPPRKLKHVAPVYPPLAIVARVSGMVIVDCVIDADGRVVAARVLRGHPLLDPAAKAAVEQWVYEPTRLNGMPVAVQMTVTVRFQVK